MYILIVFQIQSLDLLSKISGTDSVSFELVAKQEAHKRIIWTCSWNPVGHQFATGSRDKTVKIWSIQERSSVKQLTTLPQFSSSVTALSWSSHKTSTDKGFLAVGMESGLIEVWSLFSKNVDSRGELSDFHATLAVRFDSFMCHVSTVHRLAWKKTENKTLQLASCGADHCVRVFDVHED